MGRRRTIDRDKVLDAAEAVVGRVGATGLTIEAVAREAGITKGGVQYCFGAKDDLIKAMIDRWGAEFDTLVDSLAGDSAGAVGGIRGHIEATRRTDAAESSRAAVMMAALIQTSDHLAGTSAWYRRRLEGLDLSTDAGRRTRMAFLATEGVFFLRSFGFLQMDDEEWKSIFQDIEDMMPEEDGI